MPNGRPGDHPLTDILQYGASAYGPEIDSLVRELAGHPGFEAVRRRVADLLWENWPVWLNVSSDLDKVRRELRAIQAELARTAGPSDGGGQRGQRE
jgi:hypothetical protein